MSRDERRPALACVCLLAAAWCALAAASLSPRFANAADPQPSADALGQTAGQTVHNGTSAAQARILRADIEQSGATLRELEGRASKIRENLQQLREQLEELHRTKKPEKKPEDVAPKPVKQVYYRPPMEQLTEQEAITFVCENKRISHVDFAVINQTLKPVVERMLTGKSNRESFDFELPGGCFRCRGSFEKSPSLELDAGLTRIADRFGEAEEELQRPESQFQQKLKAHANEKGKFFVKFSVYPDSFDVFLRAREIVWKAGYDVGWSPMNTGEQIRLGRGGGVGVKQ